MTTRRELLGLVGGTAAAGLLTSATSAAAVPSFVAFGDSYTFPNYLKVPGWADQLKSNGLARQIVNLAWPGATAEGLDRRNTFDGQVDMWLGSYRPNGLPDRTVVYFGNNDVRTARPLAPVRQQYRTQVERLIAAGANWGTRRIVLCLLHDWSRNPEAEFNVRARVQEWNAFVAKLGRDKRNCIVVDLFQLFEDVFAKPAKYGLTNVTTPHYALSSSTHLFADGLHFGRKGQTLIRNAITGKWAA